MKGRIVEQDFDRAWLATKELRDALEHFEVDTLSVDLIKDCLDVILESFPEGFSVDSRTKIHGDMVRTIIGHSLKGK